MPIVKHILTFDGGEWSPLLDGRGDLAKYASACRRLENFLPRPQGPIFKRPGAELRGRLDGGTDGARLVEFELKGSSSIILAIGGGEMKFFKAGSAIQSGGGDLALTVPWGDNGLDLLRWKQINDVMMFVHPDHAPRILTRTNDTTWGLSNFVPGRNHAFLPENLDGRYRITASFKTNADFVTWASGVNYEAGDRVKRSGVYYSCEYDHTSSSANQPEDKPTIFDAEEEEDRLIWAKEYVDDSSTKGQKVTLTCNKALWKTGHVGSFWELATKRPRWAFEARLPAKPTAKGNNEVHSKVLTVQGNWTFQTFGNWSGKFHVQISKDRGKSWQSVQAFQSRRKTPRNASAEGFVEKRSLMRIMFTGYSANGTSGSPYAMLSVEEARIRGIVKITEFVSSKEVKAVTVTPIDKDTTSIWREGAWSDWQGYPRCIEFHQNRVLLAGTNKSPHTIWGSAVDDYNAFYPGTEADEPFAHTVMIGQREPISWLLADRALVIGSAVAEFVMRGESEDKPITPEFGVVTRQSSNGSHLRGPGVIAADSAALFIQHGGRIVRELAYSFQSDRYEAGNLTLFSEHLFRAGEITDFAVQRHPFQVIWFVAAGQLFSLSYERAQNVAAWARHPMAGTVLSVAAIRKTLEDEVWLAVQHGAAVTVERMVPGAFTEPLDDGRWSDCCQVIAPPYVLTGNPLAGLEVIGWNNGNVIGPATLNSGFFTGLSGNVVIGRPYAAKIMPMTLAVDLQNGSSRTREMRIHSSVPSLYRSRGGKIGSDPDGTRFDTLAASQEGLFTGETDEILFDGGYDKTGGFCVVSDEPFPFVLRSLCLKLNIFGDAR